jgi:8-oxo-dGTP pyrophosphatase MutT (NUDIX family)
VNDPAAPDLVEAVRRQVLTLRPVDAREVRSRDRILADLGHLQFPFDEHADPVHVTGSALVVSRRGVLLHRHKRLGLWLQPGGHVDGGESPWAASVRETAEETGLAAEHPEGGPLLWHVDVHDGGRGHTHLDLRYLLRAAPEDPRPPVGESPDVRWFDWPEAAAVADLGLAAALDEPRVRERLGGTW